MPPNSESSNVPQDMHAKFMSKRTGVLFENDVETSDFGLVGNVGAYRQAEDRKTNIIWFNVVYLFVAHLMGFYGAYLLITGQAKWQTVVYTVALIGGGIVGTTAGAHRLWSHRSYKASWSLRLLLMILHTVNLQKSIYDWVRDHRVHHKYSDTDADPHNASRGFFFSHIGWVLCRKHPAVAAKGKNLDLSDIEADSIVMFQRRHFYKLIILVTYLIPALIPVYFWNETFSNGWYVASLFRWIFQVHCIMAINSVAHMFGTRPYDKNINPVQSLLVAVLAFGEGWHNYHHTFPWDYRSSEYGSNVLNITSAFIDFCAKIGWAKDLKTVKPEMVERRARRTGDGTHPLWGWGDKDMQHNEKEGVFVLNKSEDKVH